MALIRWRDDERSPANFAGFDPFRLFDEMWREAGPMARAADFVPRVEVKEDVEAYTVKADLPGLKDEDVKITLTGNVLRIEGHRAEERHSGDKGDKGENKERVRYHVYERTFGSFARTFSLPDGVDREKVTAEMKDGVLTVVVPKRPEEKPKTISIGRK